MFIFLAALFTVEIPGPFVKIYLGKYGTCQGNAKIYKMHNDVFGNVILHPYICDQTSVPATRTPFLSGFRDLTPI